MQTYASWCISIVDLQNEFCFLLKKARKGKKMEQEKYFYHICKHCINCFSSEIRMAEVMRVNSVSMQLVSLVSAVAYPGFSQRGRQPEGGGNANLLFGQNLPKTAWKWRKLGREGKSASKILLCRFAIEVTCSFPKVCCPVKIVLLYNFRLVFQKI